MGLKKKTIRAVTNFSRPQNRKLYRKRNLFTWRNKIKFLEIERRLQQQKKKEKDCMSNLVINLPSEGMGEKEYLRDHQDGQESLWKECGSPVALFLEGRSTLRLISQSMAYDKLPISACFRPETPDPDLDLPNLQFWNCMDYGVRCLEKQFIGSMDIEIRARNYGTMKECCSHWTTITLHRHH